MIVFLDVLIEIEGGLQQRFALPAPANDTYLFSGDVYQSLHHMS